MRASRAIAVVLFLLFFAGALPSQARTFAELWNKAAYYDTNLEKKGFAALLARFEGRVGFDLAGPFQFYGAYYGVASQTNDYWDNAVYSGAGIRFRPFERFYGSGWQNEWIKDIKVFAEGLSAAYLKDRASGEANRRGDVRCGLDLWHEWNLDQPDLANFWGELWSNLSYRTTNFSWTDFNGYIFYFQPKVGRHLGRGVETYAKLDLVLSDHADYWLNAADYGLGIRFEPWRETEKEDSFLKKFKMFAEILAVSYLKNKPSDPLKNVSSDLRFGVEFSLGAIGR